MQNYQLKDFIKDEDSKYLHALSIQSQFMQMNVGCYFEVLWNREVTYSHYKKQAQMIKDTYYLMDHQIPHMKSMCIGTLLKLLLKEYLYDGYEKQTNLKKLRVAHLAIYSLLILPFKIYKWNSTQQSISKTYALSDFMNHKGIQNKEMMEEIMYSMAKIQFQYAYCKCKDQEEHLQNMYKILGNELKYIDYNKNTEQVTSFQTFKYSLFSYVFHLMYHNMNQFKYVLTNPTGPDGLLVELARLSIGLA